MVSTSTKQSLHKMLQTNDKASFELFYYKYKDEFIHYLFAMYHHFPQVDYQDIYHQSLMILLEKLNSGEDIKCHIKTYLYIIGKNLIKRHYRNYTKRKEISLTEEDVKTYPVEENKDNYFQILQKAITHLTSPGREAMQDYLLGKSLASIVKKYKYKNLNHFRKQRYKYQIRLKQIILKFYHEEY